MKSKLFSKISIVLFSIVFIVVLFKLTSNHSTKNNWDELSQQQLIQELQIGKNDTFVDLREPGLFKKAHILNAINIPFDDFQSRYQELDKNKRIVFICHDGSMGDASCQFLQRKGFSNLANLEGGMSAWTGPVVEQTK